MTSLSHWGMFDIDQMYREAFPLMTIEPNSLQISHVTLGLDFGRSPSVYQRLNFGPYLD